MTITHKKHLLCIGVHCTLVEQVRYYCVLMDLKFTWLIYCLNFDDYGSNILSQLHKLFFRALSSIPFNSSVIQCIYVSLSIISTPFFLCFYPLSIAKYKSVIYHIVTAV